MWPKKIDGSSLPTLNLRILLQKEEEWPQTDNNVWDKSYPHVSTKGLLDSCDEINSKERIHHWPFQAPNLGPTDPVHGELFLFVELSQPNHASYSEWTTFLVKGSMPLKTQRSRGSPPQLGYKVGCEQFRISFSRVKVLYFRQSHVVGQK